MKLNRFLMRFQYFYIRNSYICVFNFMKLIILSKINRTFMFVHSQNSFDNFLFPCVHLLKGLCQAILVTL